MNAVSARRQPTGRRLHSAQLHTMNLFPSATFSASWVCPRFAPSFFLLLQYNIWITIGNIGVCVECVASAEVKITAAVCIHEARLCLTRARCNVQYYISHRCHRAKLLCVCCTNKYLWANCNGRFMLNNKSSGFKGNRIESKMCLRMWRRRRRRQRCQTSAPRIIVYPIHCSRTQFTRRATQSERWKRMTHWVDFPYEKNRFTLDIFSWSENIVLKQN